jgi:hypothetical protein
MFTLCQGDNNHPDCLPFLIATHFLDPKIFLQISKRYRPAGYGAFDPNLAEFPEKASRKNGVRS